MENSTNVVQKQIITNDVLLEAYKILEMEDSGIIEEMNKAYMETLDMKPEKIDISLEPEKEAKGLVQRRAPLNPFHSPLINKIRKVPPRVSVNSKIPDPALRKNPLRGRLVTTIITSSAISFTFCQTLAANKFRHNNFFAEDYYGPAADILEEYGGVSAEFVRNGGYYRLLSAMGLHLHYKHLGINLLSQIQFLYMIEPDWGCRRTMLLYFLSGVTGFMTSCVLNPCTLTVGASGAFFGVLGSLFPYCLEYWNTIPRPWIILLYSIAVGFVSIICGFDANADNWAHIGGFVCGFLFGFATIRRLPTFSKSKMVKTKMGNMIMQFKEKNNENVIVGPDGRRRKKTVKRNNIIRLLQNFIFPDCRCKLGEIVLRLIALVCLLLFWLVLIIRLFIKYEYISIGHVTLTEIKRCCCCYFTSVKDISNWKCKYCNEPYSNLRTIEQFCNDQNSLTKTTAETMISGAMGIKDLIV